MLDDSQQVRVLILKDLMHPMHQFHVGVTSQLAKNSCRFGSAKQLRIEFAEEVGSVDISHDSKVQALSGRLKQKSMKVIR